MDWQLVILQIKRAFLLSDHELARKVGCSEAQISELKWGRAREPKYGIGVKLMELREKADGTGKAADKLGSVSEGQG